VTSPTRTTGRALVLVAVVVVVAVAAGVLLMGDGGRVPGPDDSKAGPLGNFTDASDGLPRSGDSYYVALADLDGDGADDLVSSAGQYGGGVDTTGVHAYLSRPGGGWDEASSGLPTDGTYGGLGIADLTGDGLLDIAAPTEGWSGHGDRGIGVFSAVRDASRGLVWHMEEGPVASGDYHQCVLADIDGDGRPDILAAGKDDGVRLWIGGRSGGALQWTAAGQGLPDGGSWTSVAAADVDGDGLLDVLASPYSASSPCARIYLGDGAGGFTDASDAMPRTSSTPIMVTAADVDRDGLVDVLVSLRDNGVLCLLGGRDAGGELAFRMANDGLPRDGAYRELALGDVDGDGDLDLLAACMDRGLELYLGSQPAAGEQRWTRVSLRLPEGAFSGAALGDIDGDGLLDVAGGEWGSSSDGGLTAMLGTRDDG